MGVTFSTCPESKVIGAIPTKIPWVLEPSLLFCPAASAQAKTPNGVSLGNAWINMWWFLLLLTCWIRRLVLIRVSTVDSETSDNRIPTSADMWGATCCACQLRDPSAALSCPFSFSVVWLCLSLRLLLLIWSSLILSTYFSCDNLNDPSGWASTKTPHCTKDPSSHSLHLKCVWIFLSISCHALSSLGPANRKSSTCPAIIPLGTPSGFHSQQHGSDHDLMRPSSSK